MKNLRSYLNESVWDIEDNVESDNKEFAIDEIKKFIKNNYYININRCEIVFDEKRNKYIVNLNGKLGTTFNNKSKQLTNGLFEWGEIEGDFICAYCKNLTTLQGAPKRIGGNFSCSGCSKLTSLEGAPEYVGGTFICEYCSEFKSLKGAPKKVGGGFSCGYCSKLESLEGAPKEVGRNFNCVGCNKLSSLKGAPKEVGEDFRCHKCPNLHSLDGIGKVKGKILSDIG